MTDSAAYPTTPSFNKKSSAMSRVKHLLQQTVTYPPETVYQENACDLYYHSSHLKINNKQL